MPRVKEIASRDARKLWREILDVVKSGNSDIAITRYGEPVAVLIPAADYQALAEALEDLRLGRIAEESYSEYKANREAATPYERLRMTV
jgi:prevent-host-death family protein